MAAIKDYKQKVLPFDNETVYLRAKYKFSQDGGATGNLDLLEAAEALIVEVAEMVVKKACTSGGSATVGVGKSSDAGGLVAATAVASLTLGAVIFNGARDASFSVAAGEKIQLNIATAALTDGEIDVLLKVRKA